MTNWDGNRLRGNFYSFQVGTVKFISLDADDVIYQDGASAYLNSAPDAAPETTTSGAQIPNGTVTYNHGYTGDLKIVAADNSAVPDFGSGTPNLQTLWLERTLRAAREDPSVDMIVVFMHQCAMSTSVPGNGSDLGIRRAWLPLFDRYEVDLVLSGHEHDYERSYPVRGYDAGAHGTVVSPNPDQVKGQTVDTRRPSVAADRAGRGRRHARLGHRPGHRVPGPGRRRDQRPVQRLRHRHQADGLPQAKVITERNAISGSQAAGFTRNAADSIEDAPWSAATNARRRLRLRDLRRGPRPAARRDHHHHAVLRHPRGQQRGRLRARRHDHAADARRSRRSCSAAASPAGTTSTDGPPAPGAQPGPLSVLVSRPAAPGPRAGFAHAPASGRAGCYTDRHRYF